MRRGVSKQLILTISALLLLLVAAFAWFFIPPDPNAGTHVQSGGELNVSLQLYHVTTEDGVEVETEIKRIEVANSVPGTADRYRIRITNLSLKERYLLSFRFSGFAGDDLTLCRSLELRNASILHGGAEAGAGETFFTGTLTELNGGDIAVDSVVLFAKDVLVGSGETVSLTFDLKFSETANNNEQLKALTINDIQYFGE